jgi:hypothetical protein
VALAAGRLALARVSSLLSRELAVAEIQIQIPLLLATFPLRAALPSLHGALS